jgi:opacity protein-like surface antigen
MNMKNLVALALSSSVLAAGAAFAECDPTFHIGASVDYNMIQEKDSHVSLNRPGASVFVGAKFHENFGAELGYSFIKKEKDFQGEEDLDAKFRNMYVDLVGYYGISQDVDLLGSLGIGRFTTKLSEDGEKIAKSSKSSIRGRLGAQYRFDENFATRFMVGAQKVSDAWLKSANLGVTYTF